MNTPHFSPGFVVGLTGGLASGKSTVASIFASFGAQICDADSLVKTLYQAGHAGTRVVYHLFGDDVIADDGSIDREALGHLILNDPPALEKLNQAIHPLVHSLIGSWIEALPSASIGIIEAALMVETGSYRNYDALVVVWCTPEQQIERAITRGLSEERAHSILRAQRDIDEKIKIANIIIDNRGPAIELEAKAKRAWQDIEGLAQS